MFLLCNNYLKSIFLINLTVQKKRVLRVRKNVHPIDHRLISSLPAYHRFIYKSLNFSENELPILSLIKVSEKFLNALNFKIFSQRPVHRRLKADIDTTLDEGLLLPDLLSESFSCEIKVKIKFAMIINIL